MTPPLAESLCGDKDAWLWKATGRTKDMAEGQTSTAYGYYTRREHKQAEDRRTPAATQPGNQARIRAIKRWVRENFPDCRQRMMDLTAEWYQRAEGIKAAEEYIDAEYSLITSPKGDGKFGESAGEEESGEGEGGETISSPTKDKSQKIGAPAADTLLKEPPVFKNWGELAQAAYNLGITPQAVFKRSGYNKWEDFPSRLDAWRIVEELVTERTQSPKVI
ncbi:hypothetical protein ES703_71488 [subsurface metagenome]